MIWLDQDFVLVVYVYVVIVLVGNVVDFVGGGVVGFVYVCYFVRKSGLVVQWLRQLVYVCYCMDFFYWLKEFDG